MFDYIPVNGFYRLEVQEPKKAPLVLEGKNLVTSAGLGLIASRLKDASAAAASYIACGSGTTAAALAQTALTGTEHERVAGTVTVTANKWQIAGTFGSGIGAVTIAEFGIFNAAAAGTMLARFVIPAISLSASGTVDVTWHVYIGDA